MIKDIEIGGKVCRLKSSAAIPRIYRQFFNKDLLMDMNSIFEYSALKAKLNRELKAKAKKEGEEFEPINDNLLPEHIETLENLTYILHKHGDPSQPDDIDEWFEQFEMLDIYDAFPAVINMWTEENKQLVTAKKKNAK